MIKEAIILAGGLGTRLREAVPDLPKCMAPVAGRPFLYYVINALRMQGIEHFIFSLGYKAEIIEQYLKQEFSTLSHASVIETEPLGTGGAIQLALQEAGTSHVLIANGDTLFRINLEALQAFHFSHPSHCTLALKPMQHFDRYGVVQTDDAGRILSFQEKKQYESGLINGGVYLLDRQKFFARDLPEKFSFEKDYLEAYCSQGHFFGLPQEGFFIDIGIPEDFEKAQHALKRPALDLNEMDPSWTLFLDRDGVINEERPGDYVKSWSEFIFSAGVLEVFRRLSEKFGRIIVVSNQRGVGKGLMKEEALQSIHLEMQREVQVVGGRIDQFYYCTEKEDTCFNRKPNPGMALQALKDYPGLDFGRSIMVGNKMSDMKFGRAAGMFTVFIASTHPEQAFPHPDIDLKFPSLKAFASSFK